MEKKKDVLNREEFVNTITNFVHTLSDLKRGCSFAIDGKWGSGKTFLLEMLEERLREYQSETTGDNQYFLFHYNCWQYDYYEEPAVAMVSSLLDSVKEEEKFFGGKVDESIRATLKLVKEEVKKMAGKFAENCIGVNLINIVDDVKNKKQELDEESRSFDKLFGFKETLDQIRESLKKIAGEKTLIFVVDELDRCIPSYAIKVLERLHHLFADLDNVIVIIAVDGAQLEHSIKEIYGLDTRVKEYLKKFINLTFKLDTGKLSGGIFEKYHDYFELFSKPSEDEKEEIEEFFSILWEGIDMRSQEQAMEKIQTVHKLQNIKRVDIALAIFEIMRMRFQDVDKNFMKELPKISLNRKKVLNYLTEQQYNYFLNIRDLMTDCYMKGIDVSSKNKIMGPFVELLGVVYEMNPTGAYSKRVEELVEVAVNFERIIDMVE